jgi:DUF1680 family protein
MNSRFHPITRSMTPARAAIALLASLALPFASAVAAEVPRVTLEGEVGQAAATTTGRFRLAPFDSLPWLRADLTNETVSEFDAKYGHALCRPYKQYSGDISGRFIEIMAMDSQGDPAVHPAFKGLLEEVSKQQRPGGYFCASGTIDWQQSLDTKEKDGPAANRMLPALWGNSRMLCGLVEAMRVFPADKAVAKAARNLGDFYLSVVPRFTDPERVEEYNRSGTYAAGYVTCWFPAMEGLVRLSNLTGESKYLDAAKAIAAFYERFDKIPIDHAHGMLCCQVSLLALHEVTGDDAYLKRVEKRWDELVQGGYINPAGGILEKCRVSYVRRLCDEGCAIADWLRLNLALGRVTGNTRYLAMAERTLQNHFLQNQTPKGGFGHRSAFADEQGVYGLRRGQQESTWCCTFHGQLGFLELRKHLIWRSGNLLTIPLVLDFTAKEQVGTTTSVLRPPSNANQVAWQRISLAGQPASLVRVRLPQWADGVVASTGSGKNLELEIKDCWCTTAVPVTDVEFIYSGGVYAEDRRCNRLPDGPKDGQAFVIGYGPRLLAADGTSAKPPAWPTTLDALDAQGIRPLSSFHHNKDCCFVMGCGK